MIGVDPIIAAGKLHKRYALKPPISPQKLAERLGIPIFHMPLSSHLSGLLLTEEVRTERRYLIILNSGHRRGRQVFSCAHELGHYYLHRNMSPAFMSHSKHRGIYDREADQFAAELLMPKEWVVFLARQMPFKSLVSHFQVSSAAMKRRLDELGIKAKREKTA